MTAFWITATIVLGIGNAVVITILISYIRFAGRKIKNVKKERDEYMWRYKAKSASDPKPRF